MAVKKTTTPKKIAKKAEKKPKTAKKIAVKKVAKKVVKKKVTTKKAPKKVGIVKKQKVTKKQSAKPRKVAITNSLSKKTGDHEAEDIKFNQTLESLFKKPQKAKLSNDEILLPNSVSLRSIAKVRAISKLLDDDVAEIVRKVSYAAAFCFIIAGASYASLSSGIVPVLSTSSSASISESAKSEAAKLETAIRTPELVSATEIPLELISEFAVDFELQNSEKVTAKVIATDKVFDLDIPVDSSAGNAFKVVLPGAALEPGAYRVQVTAKKMGGRGDYLFTLGKFTISGNPQVVAEADETDEFEGEEGDVAVEEVTPVALPVFSDDDGEFSLLVSGLVLLDDSLLFIKAPQSAENVGIYLRQSNSLTKRFLSSAEKDGDEWKSRMQISNIPNGSYEVISVATRKGVTIESAILPVSISKTLLSSEFEAADETASSTPSEVPPRDFSELSLSPEPNAQIEESDRIATELLRDRKTNVQILLRNYSAAMQASNETIMYLANVAIENEIASIKATEPTITDNVEKKLTDRFAALKNRINIFEETRRDTNDGLTAIDTDQDGLSDFDEKALFKTDPQNADTDQDGFTDGVEIMRGYDPLNTETEVALVYESPKDTSIATKNGVLKVTSVDPIIETDESLGKPRVQARVSGVGLPNSYVTIFVFSSPTIVTAKTDETGTFSYVFDKELEDGVHDVYVTMIDNAGAIVSQSSPFRFVKEAEAFTAPGDSINTFSEFDESGSTAPYKATIGLGILALGLILLMLGIALRRPKNVEVTA